LTKIKPPGGAGANLFAMKRLTPLQLYIAQNVFGRCGHAVTRLVEAGLVPRPQLPDSETEVREWWLVSPQAAHALRQAGQPVLQFCELYLWGRTQARGVPLEDDPALASAARPAAPPAPTGW
jgi:hypothetical protein